MKKLIINDSLSLEDFQAYPDTDILIISKDVRSIEECCLTYAYALKEIHLMHTNPDDIAELECATYPDEPSGFLTDAWSNPDDDIYELCGPEFDFSSVTLYVPVECVEAYRGHEYFRQFKGVLPEYLENPLEEDYGPYDLRTIKQQYDNGDKPDFLFFWGHTQSSQDINKTCLSQWYPCTFTVDGVTYNCAEQYMMAEKARLFDDRRTLKKILETSDPAKIKALGRKVKNFAPLPWSARSYEIVVRGNYHKFTQNPELKRFLISTHGKILVEASPYDTIWGIGMRSSDKATNPHNWKGENKLGFALSEVRQMIEDELAAGSQEEKTMETLKDNPTSGWAIIFAGGSASGKSTLISKMKFKGEVLSTDTFGEEQIEIHNNAARYATEDYERFEFAEKVVKAGLYTRFPNNSIHNKVQNLRLDFDSPTVKVSTLSALLSNGAHKYKEQYFKKHINDAANDGMRNLILDMTGKEREVNLYYDYLKSKGYKVALVWVVTNRNVALLWNAMRRRSMKVTGVHSGHNGPNKWLLQGLCDGRCDMFDDAWIIFNSTESIQRQMTEEERSTAYVQLHKEHSKYNVPETVKNRIISVLGKNPDSDAEFVSSSWIKSFFARYRMMTKVAQENGLAVPDVSQILVSFLDKDKKESSGNIKQFYKALGIKEPAIPKEPDECYDVNPPIREQFDTKEKYLHAQAQYDEQKKLYVLSVFEWEAYNKQFEIENKTAAMAKTNVTYKYDFEANRIKDYSKKVETIDETIKKAEAADVTPLVHFFEEAEASGMPIVFFGAGGAASPATFATQLANEMGLVAMTLTPMGVMGLSPEVARKMRFLAITATGKPADMVGATEYLLGIAPECVYCLTTNPIDHKGMYGRPDNKVGILVSERNPGHAICVNLSVHKDGFVGTHKHVGLSLLLYRAFHQDETGFVEKLILPEKEPFAANLQAGMTMGDISDLHILYGAQGRCAANDMEGRMLEAGVLPAMSTDLKNFTHGRHVFLDKHDKSTILMLLSPDDERFATDMLKLIPKERPMIIIRTDRNDMLGALQLMICTFYLSIDLCASRDINPFSPGAPAWGGKLWSLKIKK